MMISLDPSVNRTTQYMVGRKLLSHNIDQTKIYERFYKVNMKYPGVLYLPEHLVSITGHIYGLFHDSSNGDKFKIIRKTNPSPVISEQWQSVEILDTGEKILNAENDDFPIYVIGNESYSNKSSFHKRGEPETDYFQCIGYSSNQKEINVIWFDSYSALEGYMIGEKLIR